MTLRAAGTEILRFWKSRAEASGAAYTEHIGRRNLIDMLQTGEVRPYGHRAVGRADHEKLVSDLPVPLLALGGDREMLDQASRRAARMAPEGSYPSLGNVGMDAADEVPTRLVDAVAGLSEGVTPGGASAAVAENFENRGLGLECLVQREQVRWRRNFDGLHQGSICIQLPGDLIGSARQRPPSRRVLRRASHRCYRCEMPSGCAEPRLRSRGTRRTGYTS